MSDLHILVVGGAGYIGAHMVKSLAETGHRITILDDLSKGHPEMLTSGRLIKGDLGDGRLLDSIFSSDTIDAVMHFAAFSLVGESVSHPLRYFRNNVAKTTELLAAMVRHRIRHFIFSSTAAVYGEPTQTPITESHDCRPTNPYGDSKLAVEQMLHHCAHAHDFRYISLRYFNAAGADAGAAIGERHCPETHLIPLVLQTALGRRESIAIFGNDYDTPDGTCLRDYVHVTDLAQAHLLALDALIGGAKSNVYNLGNSRGHSVRQVIEAAHRVTGRAIAVTKAPRRAGDPAVLIASSDKIKTELGWQPAYEDLETIIETAWRWHQLDVTPSLSIDNRGACQ